MPRSFRLLSFFLVPAATLALAASCLPQPHELVGRACDTAHACGEESLICCQGTCQRVTEAALCSDSGVPDGGTDGGSPDGGCPPNLLRTGQFEQASDVQDYADRLSGKSSWGTGYVHSGSGALQVGKDPANADPTFGVQLRDSVLNSLELGPTYCISAWVSRTNTQAELFLEFTTHRTGADSEQTERIPWTLTNDDWHLFIGSSSLTSQYNRSINFRILAPYANGGVFAVDDARVWKSADGTCPEQCAR